LSREVPDAEAVERRKAADCRRIVAVRGERRGGGAGAWGAAEANLRVAERYANNAVYWAHGAAARMDMEAGTRKQEWCFNARLQMVGMRVGAGASAQPNCALFARRPGLLLARR
jgi:hypothetical protein